MASPAAWANRAALRPTALVAARTALRGEVAEWSNAPHSKCGVRATVPWVRIPPSPPRTPSTGLVYQVSAENPRGSAGFRAAIRNRGALRVPVFAPPGRVWRGPSPRGSTSVRFPCFADITGKIAKTRAKNREVKADLRLRWPRKWRISAGLNPCSTAFLLFAGTGYLFGHNRAFNRP